MQGGWDASRGGGFTNIENKGVPRLAPLEEEAVYQQEDRAKTGYASGMMRMTVLASGSKGNSTLVASSRTRILVDAGLSCRELLKRMQMANEDPAAIDALLITHEQ